MLPLTKISLSGGSACPWPSPSIGHRPKYLHVSGTGTEPGVPVPRVGQLLPHPVFQLPSWTEVHSARARGEGLGHWEGSRNAPRWPSRGLGRAPGLRCQLFPHCANRHRRLLGRTMRTLSQQGHPAQPSGHRIQPDGTHGRPKGCVAGSSLALGSWTPTAPLRAPFPLC